MPSCISFQATIAPVGFLEIVEINAFKDSETYQQAVQCRFQIYFRHLGGAFGQWHHGMYPGCRQHRKGLPS